MASSALLPPGPSHPRFKSILWISLGLTVLFVFITSEVLLITDYPMYHAYRLQVIADRHLLIPHTLSGIFALLIGPINFSSRVRQRYLRLQPRAQPMASLLEPPRRQLLRCGRHRVHTCLAADRGSWPELARTHHSPWVIRTTGRGWPILACGPIVARMLWIQQLA